MDSSDQIPIISCRDLQVSHGDSILLTGINLHIGKGGFYYLIGKTGSGKSSFLKTLYAAHPLSHGSAEVVGVDLGSLHRSDVPLLRRKLGMVFQDFLLLEDRSVYKNLDFALKATGWKKKERRKKRIFEVLRTVDLIHKADSLPGTLSGGEKQRTAIGRALLNHPLLIIADEPTGNLDPATSDEIFFLFKQLNMEFNTAFLIATHDYRLLDKFPGQILECKNGTLLEKEFGH